MSRVDTWMPLDIGDYLGDTMHLSTVEHGAYLLLLMHYWRSGPLADDDKKLAGIARLQIPHWLSMSKVVREFFTKEGDGLLHQKRCDMEREKREQISSKRRASAMQMHSKRSADADTRGRAVQSQLPVQEEVAKPLTVSQDTAREPVALTKPKYSPEVQEAVARQIEKEKARYARLGIPWDPPPVEGLAFDPLNTGMADLKTVDGHPCCNGFYVDIVFEELCKLAGIRSVTTLASWKPLIQWLKEGYEPWQIKEIIGDIADRPGYEPPQTLGYFTKPLHEKGRVGMRMWTT